MSNSTSETTPKFTGQLKDESRDSRLSFRNFGEHKLRKELKDIAIEKCRLDVKSFGKCAEENGLLVVFKCRQELRSMSDCIESNRSEQHFQKYMAKHKPEMLLQYLEDRKEKGLS
uniref:COX assembly mitochondrial protein n=1 Tax=Proboscia inermis TaxID=420281 RepID=A0A7S0GCI0_9STRA|mmetsp:Transcript_20648/g.20932  ORF Transcript_20648/g.20932 Transcript_20648/m.20932 type:complete len:115 (+) Transcript_20648:92-436(+)